MAWSAPSDPITGQLITAGFWKAQIPDNMLILKTSIDNNGHLQWVGNYKTANYTLTASDDVIMADPSAGTLTLTLPSGGGVTSKRYEIKHLGTANQVIISAGSEFIDSSHSFTLEIPMQSVTLQRATQFGSWVIL